MLWACVLLCALCVTMFSSEFGNMTRPRGTSRGWLISEMKGSSRLNPLYARIGKQRHQRVLR